MNTIRVNKLIEILLKLYSSENIKNIPPIMLWGSPGIGKSQAIKQVSELLEKETGKQVILTDIRLVLFNPVDLRGIPVVDKEKEAAIWLRPEIFKMDDSENIINILFLDELTSCPQSIQACAYQIILDRKVGEHKLPDNCIVIAAGNKIEDRSVSHKLSKALANRLVHLEVEPNIDDWKQWAMQNKIDKRILGYLNFNNSYLFKFSPESSENAFPTPRTWEMVNKTLSIMDMDSAFPFIAGSVGESTAFDFFSYSKCFDKLPDIKSILDGKTNKVPKEPDVNFALCSAIASKSLELNKNSLANLLKYSINMLPEYAVLLFKDILSANRNLLKTLILLPEFDLFQSKFGKLLEK